MIKLLILLFVVLASFSCNTKRNEHFSEGIYGLKTYFDKNTFDSNYVEYFLLCVNKDKLINYGTVNTWGNAIVRNPEEEKKYLVNDSTIINPSSPTKEQYIKLIDAEKIVGRDGINIDEFTNYLNKYLIAGNYKLHDSIVNFTKDGNIDNLDTLKTFSANPRFGTLWWYDYRTIKLNGQVWKYSFTEKNFILTKYLEPAIEKMAELSNTKIILVR